MTIEIGLGGRSAATPRYLLLTLAVGVVGLSFYYWDTLETNRLIALRTDEIKAAIIVANVTILNLGREITPLQSKVGSTTDEINKYKNILAAKDKIIANLTATVSLGNHGNGTTALLHKLEDERTTAIQKATELKAQINKCNDECLEKVKAIHGECSKKKTQADLF